jgi:hypothetical protein
MVKSRPLPLLSVDPAAPDDAPTQIDLKTLADDSLTLTGMYRELARRHDALVDAVDAWLKQQAK